MIGALEMPGFACSRSGRNSVSCFSPLRKRGEYSLINFASGGACYHLVLRLRTSPRQRHADHRYLELTLLLKPV